MTGVVYFLNFCCVSFLKSEKCETDDNLDILLINFSKRADRSDWGKNKTEKSLVNSCTKPRRQGRDGRERWMTALKYFLSQKCDSLSDINGILSQ